MPTISGLRRRGVTPQALRAFAYHIGITKYNALTDVAVLEKAIRDDLNQHALRRLAVLRPIKVVITNYPKAKSKNSKPSTPRRPDGRHAQDSVQPGTLHRAGGLPENPPPKYFRLRPGGEVRLKYAFIIKCEEVVKDATGKVVELRCAADLDSKSGGPNAARKVKGTIHWVSAAQAIDAEVRLYDRLFTVPEPDAAGDFKGHLNPHSLETVTAKMRAEPEGRHARPPLPIRAPGLLLPRPPNNTEGVFNRTITLKDAWAKEVLKG